MSIKVRKSLDALKPYNVGGRANLSQDWECFDWNESEFPPTNKIFEVMKTFYRYERYPDINASKLKDELSKYVDLPSDFIEVYNGSDDAPKDIITVFVDTYTSIIPSTILYSVNIITTNTDKYISSNILDPLGEHSYNFNLCNDVDVVYLVNPNNPTGY